VMIVGNIFNLLHIYMYIAVDSNGEGYVKQ